MATYLLLESTINLPPPQGRQWPENSAYSYQPCTLLFTLKSQPLHFTLRTTILEYKKGVAVEENNGTPSLQSAMRQIPERRKVQSHRQINAAQDTRVYVRRCYETLAASESEMTISWLQLNVVSISLRSTSHQLKMKKSYKLKLSAHDQKKQC